MRLLETRRFKADPLMLGLRSLHPVSIPDVNFLLSRQLVLTFIKELFLISAGHVSQHGGSHEAPIVAHHVHIHRLLNYTGRNT